MVHKEPCEITDLLKEKGLRRTKDRHSILALFRKARAWTAAQLAREFNLTDLSTIYRNLQQLRDAGIIRELHAHGGRMYFEHSGRTHHDHLACENCDVIECVPCPLPKTPNHVIEIHELCSTCK